MSIKSKVGKGIFLIGLVMLFTGCGGQSGLPGNGAEATSGAAVSGVAVSGDAISVSGDAVSVSGDAIQEQKTAGELEAEQMLFDEIKHQPYANSFHIFEGDKKRGIYQYSLTGEEENFYETGDRSYPDVVWVDDECILYFSNSDDYFNDYYVTDMKDQFYYAPIAGGSGKKQILLDQKVLLTEGEIISDFIAKRGDEVYFVMTDEKLCKMNIKTREITELKLGKSEYCAVVHDFNGQPCVQDDKAYLAGSDKNIYQIDLKQWRAEKLGTKLLKDYQYYSAPLVTVDEHNMYFARENRDHHNIDEIVKVSLETGEETVLVKMEEVKELVKKYSLKKFDEKETSVGGNVVKWNKRLYFALLILDDSERPELKFEEEWLLFHCVAEDGSKVTFEKDMADFMRGNIKPYMVQNEVYKEYKPTEALLDVDGVPISDPSVDLFLSGVPIQVLGEEKFVIEYYDGEQVYDEKDDVLVEKGEKSFILYDTKTNQAKKFGEGTAEYGLLRASGYKEYAYAPYDISGD